MNVSLPCLIFGGYSWYSDCSTTWINIDRHLARDDWKKHKKNVADLADKLLRFSIFSRFVLVHMLPLYINHTKLWLTFTSWFTQLSQYPNVLLLMSRKIFGGYCMCLLSKSHSYSYPHVCALTNVPQSNMESKAQATTKKIIELGLLFSGSKFQVSFLRISSPSKSGTVCNRIPTCFKSFFHVPS